MLDVGGRAVASAILSARGIGRCSSAVISNQATASAEGADGTAWQVGDGYGGTSTFSKVEGTEECLEVCKTGLAGVGEHRDGRIVSGLDKGIGEANVQSV